MSQNYTIRNLALHELDFAIDLAAQEGWNPGLYDAQCFHAADPQGFLAGFLDGEPIASLSAVNYRNGFGFLGLYIVKPEYRSQGYGKQLWQAASDHLAGCTVGLDGVVEQQENYKKHGLVVAHRNIRFQGSGGSEKQPHPAIVELAALPFAEVKRYDRRFFPAEREAFLQQWINQPRGAALGIAEDNRLCAYGVLRACRSGYKIGPLCAETPGLADTLFNALRGRVPETEAVFLDVPECNPAALELIDRYRMSKVFETARMYRGVAPQLPLQQIYGITTFELG